MSRSLRTLSVLARPSNHFRPLTRSKHSLLRHNGEINVQQVRFTRPFAMRAKRFGYQLALTVALCYCAMKYFLVEEEETGKKTGTLSKTQGESGDKAKDGTQEDGVDEDDVEVPEVMPENAFFFPLGRPRRIPPTYYKGTDPEWQSFIEFRKDHKRSGVVQKELVSHIYSFYTGTPSVHRNMGVGVPVKLGRVWLDIIIPQGPSAEYERSGLEITPEYIAWTTRPVSALQVARLNSAIMPLPVAKSLWASCNTYYSLQLAKLKQYLNADQSSSEDSPQLPVGDIQIDQFGEKSPSKETQNRAQMNEMPAQKSDVGSPKDSAKPTASNSSKIYQIVPSLPLPHSDIGTAIKEFKRSMAKNWQIPNTVGERGTFVVTGDIELVGPKGSCVLAVVADYHPREAKYKNIRIIFKYLIPRRQRPTALSEPKENSPKESSKR